ncbi:MAG: hypothetical protein K6A65_04170 [Succinivibrionaceae bacterium]|nr:hypothetical protein [Succinivibrionaceae bacterium]
MPSIQQFRSLALALSLALAVPLLTAGCAGTTAQQYARPVENPELWPILEEHYQQVLAKGSAELRLPQRFHGMSLDNSLDEGNRIAVQRLQGAGYDVYLVGGQIRDRLLGKKGNDIDLATNAPIVEIERLFKPEGISIIKGSNFVHSSVTIAGSEISIAPLTLPKPVVKGIKGVPGFDESRQTTDSPLLDSYRRDFTYNALYLDLGTMEIIDYHGGIRDARDGIIRLVVPAGVNMNTALILRSIRFKARFNNTFSPDLENYLRDRSHFEGLDPAAVATQMIRILSGGFAARSVATLREYGMLEYLYPPLRPLLGKGGTDAYLDGVAAAMDEERASGGELRKELALAAMVSPAVEARAARQGIRRAIKGVLDEEGKAFTYDRYGFRKGEFREGAERILSLSHRLLSGKATAADLQDPFLGSARIIIKGWAKTSARAREALGRLGDPTAIPGQGAA